MIIFCFHRRYVLKPQREGGGNNVYGHDIPDALSVCCLLLSSTSIVHFHSNLKWWIPFAENDRDWTFGLDSDGTNYAAYFQRIHDSSGRINTTTTCRSGIGAGHFRRCHWVSYHYISATISDGKLILAYHLPVTKTKLCITPNVDTCCAPNWRNRMKEALQLVRVHSTVHIYTTIKWKSAATTTQIETRYIYT